MGLVAAACLSEGGNHVISVDKDATKIDMLKAGEIPIYEPGLKELVERNMHHERLEFMTDLNEAVAESLVCFIAVGTPPAEDGSADMSAIRSISASSNSALAWWISSWR